MIDSQLKLPQKVHGSPVTNSHKKFFCSASILKHRTVNFHTCIVTKFECFILLKNNTK